MTTTETTLTDIDATPHATESETKTPFYKRPKVIRLSILAVILLGLWGLGEATGMNAYLTQENIQTAMTEAGWWGVLLFILAFMVGNLVQVPGWVFIAAAIVAYGPLEGIGVSVIGGLAAVTTSFAIVRTVGGKSKGEVKNKFMRKVLAKLDERPILSVIVLRILFMVSPPLNYALALSRLSYRDYVVGSAIGIVLPISAVSVAMSCFMT